MKKNPLGVLGLIARTVGPAFIAAPAENKMDVLMGALPDLLAAMGDLRKQNQETERAYFIWPPCRDAVANSCRDVR